MRHQSTRPLILLGSAVAAVACNVYTADMWSGVGGSSSGGVATGGGSPVGGTGSGGVPLQGGSITGGVSTGGTGALPTGGTPGTGGEGAGGSGSTGGTSGTGGESTGGEGGRPITYVMGDLETIDDFETTNAQIEFPEKSYWFTYGDTSGGTIVPEEAEEVESEPLEVERGDSTKGIHVVAQDDFTVWGSGVGFDLQPSKEEYDASVFGGLVFYARTSTGFGEVDMRVKINTSDVIPPPGGSCAEGTDCNDDYGRDITLTEDWQEFQVWWDEEHEFGVSQGGWGYTPAGGFNSTIVLSIQLQAKDEVAFDIWLDDISFFEVVPED